VTMPTASNGNMLVPNADCAARVRSTSAAQTPTHRRRLARTEVSMASTLISDAFVDSDYESQPYEGAYYATRGVFTFHVATHAPADVG